jgi:hypothetical protein
LRFCFSLKHLRLKLTTPGVSPHEFQSSQAEMIEHPRRPLHFPTRNHLPSHQIRISASERPGHYAVSGACQIDASTRPIIDAAFRLKASGAVDSDTLRVTGTDVSVIPMPLAKIIAERPSPPSLGSLKYQTLAAMAR